MSLSSLINNARYPIANSDFKADCKKTLEQNGALILPDFLSDRSIERIIKEGESKQHLAWYTQSTHNVYLSNIDPDYGAEHARNKQVNSSKGCITDDQIDAESPLRALYDSPVFRDFLADVLGEKTLYNYADPLSSINLHYASEGQELGWHFDNSSFAITLLIQKPSGGGVFEYIENMRDADAGEMNYSGVSEVLSVQRKAKELAIEPGALVLFRGRNAIHRVTPTQGDTTRMLAVLAYNSKPGVALSEAASKTFYGRVS
ncbi:2OG-Fe(II) oxygenase [Marinomonas sp. IMCC 4694]|uniref:HalD/BesD family halogenase n=1 Tax=Marinomonas sp. IMCC 4694 TaxID=2605432 RepID=UPI0011E64E9D|nr:2OG-Fe(II) oxygenase [Marinomonas sp. IMCC 4694]TYL46978.1 2OG-Fe(II) oxygenase [Marinomonas sp. IMCC 4694]